MRKLALFSGGFVSACVLYVRLLSPETALLFGLALIAVAAFLYFCTTDRARKLRIVSIAAAVGLLWSYSYEIFRIEPMRALCGEDVFIEATVSGYPERTKYGCRVETSVHGGTMLLYLNKDYMHLKPSDRLSLRAEIADVSRGSGEEENLYFQSKDISLLGFANEEPTIVISDGVALRFLPGRWAQSMSRRIVELFPSDTEGFMRALLLGDKEGISYKASNQMSITGLSHVFSVSGMHVSLLVGFFVLVIQRKRLAAICGMIAMALFAAMLGFTPSVTRAVIMNTVLLLAPILRRENDPVTTLSFALLVIVLGNPWAIANVGLQLSFLAMAGIFLFAKKLHLHIMGHFRLSGIWEKILSMFSVNFATSLSATVLTMPLIAVNFGTISLISPLANLLLLNLISLIFSLGFAILLAGMITPIGSVLASLISWPIRAVLFVVQALSKSPFAAAYSDGIYFVAWLVMSYVMLAICLLVKRERKMRYLIAALVATLLCAIGFSLIDAPQGSVMMFDVGQGQSILLQSGSFTAVVDCGGERGDADGETVARKLLQSGHSQLDVLILTHYDIDHSGGVEQLLSRVEVNTVCFPDFFDEEGRRFRLIEAAKAAGCEIRLISEKMSIEASGSRIELLACISDNSDNDGLCALMSLGECDILVTGDLDIEAEHRLLQTYELPQVEILVAGHHGSKYATSAALLRRIRPQTVLISVGENSYGHPSAEVLERIEQIGAKVCSTKFCGNITILR